MQECAQDLQEIMHKMQKLQEKMQGGGMMGQRSYMRYGQRNNGGQNFSGNGGNYGGNYGQRWGNMPMMNGQGFMGDNSPMMMSGQAEIDPRFFAMFD